jgi:hypothetical protein
MIIPRCNLDIERVSVTLCIFLMDRRDARGLCQCLSLNVSCLLL